MNNSLLDVINTVNGAAYVIDTVTGLGRTYSRKPAKPVQIDELYENWKAYIDRSKSTVTAYTKGVKAFLKWMQENGISEPNQADIIRYKNDLKDAGYQVTTINLYLTAVKQFFKWLDAESIYPDVADRVTAYKLDDSFRKDNLTAEQAHELLQSIDQSKLEGLRDYAMLSLMVTTGLRTVEVQRARICDIRTRGNSKVLYVQGKGESDRMKYVKLVPDVEKAIRKYLRKRPAHTTANSENPLFMAVSKRTARQVQPMTTRSIRRIVKNAMTAAGLDSPTLTAHSLRHTAAVLNLENGGTVEETQQLLRHANPKTTLIYLHGIERDRNESESRIAQVVL